LMAVLPEVNCAPRRMLPPPRTMAIWAPKREARWTCPARWTTASMAMPRSPWWLKPSPEIFKITRR